MRTLEQLRAEHALICAKCVEKEKWKGKYRSYIERFAPAVVMNGLGQALASELAAGGENPSDDSSIAHRRIYDNLQSWLCRKVGDGDPYGGVYPGAKDLLRAITQNDEDKYLRAQAEALAWLEWHKKFCQAYLPREGE